MEDEINKDSFEKQLAKATYLLEDEIRDLIVAELEKIIVLGKTQKGGK